MKRVIAACACVLCLALSGCGFLDCLFDPACELRGTWAINHALTVPDEPAYDRLNFSGEDVYSILDAAGTVIERGTMTDVTGEGFTGTIETQTLYPALIGGTTYAAWDVDGDTLTIAFYDDPAMATLFITFVCTKL
jgi:hypothetical protein